MRNPWKVITSNNERKICQSKRNAAAFACEWVEDHPGESATVFRRCDMQRAVRTEWDGDSIRTVRIRARAKRSSRPPQGFAELADATLRELGYTTLRARQIRHAVFDLIKKGLQYRDEPIAWTPIGVFFVARRRRFWLLLHWLRKNEVRFKFNTATLEALQ
jgi:hypothetical protein